MITAVSVEDQQVEWSSATTVQETFIYNASSRRLASKDSIKRVLLADTRKVVRASLLVLSAFDVESRVLGSSPG